MLTGMVIVLLYMCILLSIWSIGKGKGEGGRGREEGVGRGREEGERKETWGVNCLGPARTPYMAVMVTCVAAMTTVNGNHDEGHVAAMAVYLHG